MAALRPLAVVFDTFGTVVDWRGSLIADLSAFGAARGIRHVDWGKFADEWRRAYHPSLDSVREGRRPFAILDVLHRASLDAIVKDFGLAGLSEDDLRHMNLVWHRLKGWPDAVPGLTRLKSRYIIGPASNGNVALLTNMAKFAGLPWDVILGSDVFGEFKPSPKLYLGIARFLGIEPGQLMMAAAHNRDLANARKLGLMTAFFPRPLERGPYQRDDFEPDQEWDIVAKDIEDLATQLGV
jgi:2-haloacid dehalogenase